MLSEKYSTFFIFFDVELKICFNIMIFCTTTIYTLLIFHHFYYAFMMRKKPAVNVSLF